MTQVGDVTLSGSGLKGRSFLLGNKRAFSLSLPAASGASDAMLHPHKWCGAYLYGRKYLEGQVVRAHGETTHLLNGAVQRGFIMALTHATRHYRIEGQECSEEYFVPDAIQGVACTVSGPFRFTVEPEFDMRLAQSLDAELAYEVEPLPGGAIIANVLPSGIYDDASESFLPDGREQVRVFAAVQVIGPEAAAEIVPAAKRVRRKVFRHDRQRHRYVLAAAPAEAVHDHAPLWTRSESRVCAPVRLQFHQYGTIVYGFGATREEALEQLATLRDNLTAYRVQKQATSDDIVQHAAFHTGQAEVDTAYLQVLSRLMDALVARNAQAPDTALSADATMILAGNQYFHDSWKRDENIALGFLLNLGFYDLARSVIRDTWQLQDERTGRLPQRIRAGEAPAYHSSDGTLWALHRLHQYWRCTGDDALLYDKLPMIEIFFRRALERTVDGMLPSGRTTSPDYLWETWMDTAHTPRHGFPIEIQLLWIACLRAFRPILRPHYPELEESMRVAEAAAWVSLQRFIIRGLPADSLDESGMVRDLITPNPYFCFGVGLDLGPEVETVMREIGRRQLAGRQGIVTLAPQDWERVFPAEFLANRRLVRGRRMRSIGKYNYHRGVEWNWLSTFFVQAELKYGQPNLAARTYVGKLVGAALHRGGIGGISELFDLDGTRGPDFQAWSMSGLLESLHAFAGVQIDVPQQRISVAPQLPAGWPELTVRKWYADIPFDLHYRTAENVQTVTFSFPYGRIPAADFELSLVLPARHVAEHLLCDRPGVSVSAPHVAPIPGTALSRVHYIINPGDDFEVRLLTRRAGRRAEAVGITRAG